MEKITIGKIKTLVSIMETKGYSIKTQDILYILARHLFDDSSVVYAMLYGKDNAVAEAKNMDKSKKIKDLTAVLQKECPEIMATLPNTQRVDITFEENKAYMLSLKMRTEEAIKKQEITKKDGLKILADLSTKLNDKFQVGEAQEEHRVIVQPKFNTICEHTHKECWLQTKEFAMKRWNLVEKDGGEKKEEEEEDSSRK